MKVLSVRQPWAFWIACGQKNIENRSWSTDYRGPTLIHAAKGMTEDEYLDAQLSLPHWFDLGACGRLIDLLPSFELINRGGVVAVAELSKVVASPSLPDHVLPWETTGGYAWHFQRIRQTPFVPWKGARGLWDAPAELLDMIVDRGGLDG